MTQPIGGPIPARTAWGWPAVGKVWWRRWLDALATLARAEAGDAAAWFALAAPAPLLTLLLLPAAGFCLAFVP